MRNEAVRLNHLFDPRDGVTVVEPPERGSGHWAGAPSVFFDESTGLFYLSYRLRRPRSEQADQPDRGYETRIAISTDGSEFRDIWRLEKTELGSASIERCALRRHPDGRWQLYIAYVGGDNRWRTDLIEASAPDAFEAGSAVPILVPADLGIEGVKDPWVINHGGIWHMFISFMPTPEVAACPEALHGTADVFNTGLGLSCTGLATSEDGRQWTWRGMVMRPDRPGAWDSYCTRICSAFETSKGWTAFYDGSASVKGNYEEHTGVARARSIAAESWESLTPDGPVLVGPDGGSLRYVDTVLVGGRRFFYYEMARADGSHELRCSVVS